jgi:hypothetical protein
MFRQEKLQKRISSRRQRVDRSSPARVAPGSLRRTEFMNQSIPRQVDFRTPDDFERQTLKRGQAIGNFFAEDHVIEHQTTYVLRPFMLDYQKDSRATSWIVTCLFETSNFAHRAFPLLRVSAGKEYPYRRQLQQPRYDIRRWFRSCVQCLCIHIGQQYSFSRT